MKPMRDFDPDRPAQVHDRLNHSTFFWQTGWADNWRENAVPNKIDGTVSWDGLILDGWDPLAVS
jgi:hypothetical protein